jgi:hypothetical protein
MVGFGLGKSFFMFGEIDRMQGQGCKSTIGGY